MGFCWASATRRGTNTEQLSVGIQGTKKIDLKFLEKVTAPERGGLQQRRRVAEDLRMATAAGRMDLQAALG